MNSTIEALQGKYVVAVSGMRKGGDEVRFTLQDGTTVLFGHMQDCCESVWLEDVDGDPEDLVDQVLVVAEERVSEGESSPNLHMGQTWTYYTFRTQAGTVTLRWIGESNGYYSERVDMYVDGKRVWRD